MAGINDYSNTAGSNTTINGIDIAEGCSPAGINNAIRQLMADIADMDDGVVPLQTPDINGGTIDGAIIGGTTPAAGTFTTLTANTSITGTLNTAAQTNITSVGTLSALTVSGDLTVDTNTLYVDSANNRVGVRTSSPTDVFQIDGPNSQLRLRDTDDSTFVQLSQSASKLVIRQNTLLADHLSIGSSELVINDTSNDYDFRVEGNNNTHALFVRGSDDRVGIGTSAPQSALELANTDAEIVILDNNAFSSGVARTAKLNFKALNPNSAGTIESAGIHGVVTPTTGYTFNEGYLSFYTRALAGSYTEKLRITGDGKVGIGTTSPAELLHIESGTNGEQVDIRFRGLTTTAGAGRSANVGFDPDPNDNGNSNEAQLYLSGNASDKTLVATASGNIGIGTASPQKSLHIVGPDGSVGVTEGNSNTALYLDNNDSCILNIQSGTGSTDYGAVFFSDAEAQNQGAVKYNHPNNQLEFNTGGQRKAYIGTDKFVINEDSENVDFRVESNNNSNMLFVNGGTDRVGIGTGSPSGTLDIASSDANYQLVITPSGTNANGTINFNSPGTGGAKIRVQGTERVSISNAGVFNITGSLTVNGSAVGGGGKVLQVVSATKTDTASTTSTTYGDITGLSVSITPSSTSSKIYVVFSVAAGNSNGAGYYRLVRNTTALAIGDAAGSRTQSTIASEAGAGNRMEGLGSNYLDSPSTTSATTYKVQWRVQNSGTNIYLNRSSTDSDNESHPRGSSTITVMEIGA